MGDKRAGVTKPDELEVEPKELSQVMLESSSWK